MNIYLCGPIMGCTDEECRNWREEAKKRFPNTIDPMRRDYRGKELESAAEIVELDKMDVDDSDILLVNHPQPSVGTSMEVLYAWERSKFIVVVIPKGAKLSPWMLYHSDFVVESFEEAYRIIQDYIHSPKAKR